MASTWVSFFLIVFLGTMGMGQRFDGPDAGVRVGPNFDVVLSDLDEGQQFNDHVNGMRSCGGSGQLLAMRYESCYPGPSICQVPSDNVNRRAELHFAPSQDISSLGVRVTLSTRGISPTVVYDKIMVNNEVYRGNKYSMSTEIAASKMFQGRKVTIQFELYREFDGGVEICSVVELEIV